MSLRKVLRLRPYEFHFFYQELKFKSFTLLDVGCGNHSPTLTKHWFKNCNYYGLDKIIYNNEEADLECMEKFFQIDLEDSNLKEIPDGFFDVIIMSHVIEHLRDGLPVLEKVTKKLSEGGKIYIEFPSLKSLSLPSAEGTLNFCDDDTHVRLYDLKEVVNTLLFNNIRIIKAGRRRNWRRIFLTPLTIPLQLYFLIKYRKMSAKWLIDLMGFADFVYGERQPINAKRDF